jgi:hypothetical protein
VLVTVLGGLSYDSRDSKILEEILRPLLDVQSAKTDFAFVCNLDMDSPIKK